MQCTIFGTKCNPTFRLPLPDCRTGKDASDSIPELSEIFNQVTRQGLEPLGLIFLTLIILCKFLRDVAPKNNPFFTDLEVLEARFSRTGGDVASPIIASIPLYSVELETPGNLPVSSGGDTVSLSDHQPVAILSDGSHNIERIQS